MLPALCIRTCFGKRGTADVSLAATRVLLSLPLLTFVTGFTLQDVRCALGSEHVEKLMFVDQNKDLMPTAKAIVERYMGKNNKGKAPATS